MTRAAPRAAIATRLPVPDPDSVTRTRHASKAWQRLALICVCAGAVACSSSGGDDDDADVVDTVPPAVIPGKQVDAARNRVVATFSERMDAATIDANSFTVVDGGGSPVAGTVAYNGLTATFSPATQLAPSSNYVATIFSTVRDLAGNRLPNDVSWAFVTASGNMRFSWNPNPESAVNRAGGGYRVYYSNRSGFAPGDIDVTEIDVPYVSGTHAPTSIVVALDPGIYFVRIGAYSALNAPGGIGGTLSQASPQFELDAP